MNLIEQLGGYERAKNIVSQNIEDFEEAVDEVGIYHPSSGWIVHEDLVKELLEYRRQHNIFEVGDLITHPVFWGLFQVKETMKHHVLGVTSTGYESKLAMELIRHAEPEEIKAGKRLEVK